jgi:hypothetical protein
LTSRYKKERLLQQLLCLHFFVEATCAATATDAIIAAQNLRKIRHEALTAASCPTAAPHKDSYLKPVQNTSSSSLVNS